MDALQQTAAVEELETKLAAQKVYLRDLATMGAVVTSILEMDAVLSVTMDMAIRLVDGEVGAILIEEQGELKDKVAWGIGQSFVRSLLYEDGLDLASYCFQHRETVILADLELRSEEGIVIDSVIASPIKTKDSCRGVAVIINKAGGGNFEAEDREVLEMLLNFVAVAVENSFLVKDKLKQQKVAQEMAIARQVQETILSDDFDSIQGAEIGAVYFPAGEVGGDFYDILKIDDRRFIVIIGDVSNKGIPAALVMSACSGVIKTTLEHRPDIGVGELATLVNNIMAEQIIKDREMFVTLFFSRFDLDQKELRYCNAGHIPGLFRHPDDPQITELAEGGPILGQFAGVPYQEGCVDIQPGDRLFLFTDGLTEAEDSDGNLFGRVRAEQVFSIESGLNPNDFCLKVKEWLDRFAEGAADDSHDDFTILQVKVRE